MRLEQLKEIRNLLLNLHKTLLDYERKAYEGQHGKISSPGAMLGLVMENKSFAWLRQLSGVIVGLDELLDNKHKVAEHKYTNTAVYIKQLLTPNIHGNDFAKKYFAALQNHPGVALAHSKIHQALTKTLPK